MPIILVFFCVLIAACAPTKQYENYETENSHNIIGGYDLGPSSNLIRSVVVILNQNNVVSANLCTGTFISSTIILTAAHCVSNDKNDLIVKMGNSIFSEQEAISFHVLAVKIHEDYQKTENDLALIQVQRNSQVEVVPVQIDQQTESLNKKNMTVLGYGMNQVLDSDDEFQGAGRLRSLRVIFERIRIDQYTFKIDQSQGAGACHGDSGGPAFVMSKNQKMVLAGVASGVVQAEDEIDCTNQSVYTKVNAYKSWIIRMIHEMNSI